MEKQEENLKGDDHHGMQEEEGDETKKVATGTKKEYGVRTKKRAADFIAGLRTENGILKSDGNDFSIEGAFPQVKRPKMKTKIKSGERTFNVITY